MIVTVEALISAIMYKHAPSYKYFRFSNRHIEFSVLVGFAQYW